MRPIRSSATQAGSYAFYAGILLSLLGGCAMDHHAMHHGNRDGTATNANQILQSPEAKRFEAQAAILVGPQGEINVVSANKERPATACRIEGSKPSNRGQADLPVCQHLDNTRVERVDSLTVLRHTGSNCVTIVTPWGSYQVCY